jgi:hypothetical protein
VVSTQKVRDMDFFFFFFFLRRNKVYLASVQ